MMDFGEAAGRSRSLNERFRKARGMEWKHEVMLTDLAEEVGELANAILTAQGFKSEKRKKSDMADSLCDVMFDVFMIAGCYGIDPGKEYARVLEDLDVRLKREEF